MTLRRRLQLLLGFMLVTPLITFLLIWMRGLPDFAQNHVPIVLGWVFSVTWVPAMLSGGLLTAILAAVIRRGGYFHKPYDFGRCFSLGAISGALAEAAATGAYRAITDHPFSDFWIAGAMISGCLAGGFLVAWTAHGLE
jgi:hypothetical protein